MGTASNDRTGELWQGFAEQVSSLGRLVMQGRPAGEQVSAEGLRYMLRYLAAGISTCVEFDDALHPEFGSLIENRRSWGLDNPDTKYSFTRIDPGATYAVTGDPGTATELELQVDTDHFADGRFAEWNCLRRWRRGAGTLPLDAEGLVSLTFEAPERSSYLHLREYFGDWGSETPALLAVERVGSPLPPPPLGMPEMESRMELLGLWLTSGAQCWSDLGRSLASGVGGAITPFAPSEDAVGLGGQAYGFGGYQCGADDAVVLEFTPPECSYWSVSLATWFWESADIANRQCSLNHTQVVPDVDGAVRIVLSQRDPGVANWVDPSGHESGTVAFRLLDAAELPTLGYLSVPIADLDQVLPGGTCMESPTERAASLRRRRDSVVARYRR